MREGNMLEIMCGICVRVGGKVRDINMRDIAINDPCIKTDYCSVLIFKMNKNT